MRKAAGIPLFNDVTIFHIHHAAGRFARHFHFVGDDNLRNTGFSQLANADDLSGDFRVERCGRFIKQQDLGSIISARAMATRCCWPPERCSG
jgi:hypothetical protein